MDEHALPRLSPLAIQTVPSIGNGIVTVIRYTATAIISSSHHFQNVIRC